MPFADNAFRGIRGGFRLLIASRVARMNVERLLVRSGYDDEGSYHAAFVMNRMMSLPSENTMRE